MSTVNLLGVSCQITQCINCGIPFTVPVVAWDHQIRMGGHHFCPNGHRQGWDAGGETEFTRLRQERDRLKQGAAQKDDEIARERNLRRMAEKDAQRIADKAQRAAKRTLAATCPCCNRSFANLARHLKTQHQIVNGKPLTVVAGGKK